MSCPSDDFRQTIFFEVHNNLPREGPGSVQSTLRAFQSIDSNDKQLNILDIACGPGVATIELARLRHHITAIDKHQPFIKTLLTQAKEELLSDRIHALIGDMFCLEKYVPQKAFDVLWCEGAIYIIGLERGLIEWKEFLKMDGYLVCSELCWLSVDQPIEAQEFWSKNYPGMHSQEENLEIIKKCGYELIDTFVLDEKDWWNEYYEPMEKQIQELKLKYKENKEVEEILCEQQLEIDLYRKYSEAYGYVFYIMKNINV